MLHTSRREADAFRNTGPKTDPPYQLTDDQWEIIADLFPDPPVSSKGGRPPKVNQACFEGILWVLTSGARWKDLPRCFPSKSVCHARFVKWMRDGRFEEAWRRLLKHFRSLKQLNLKTLIGDGTFAPANSLELFSKENRGVAA